MRFIPRPTTPPSRLTHKNIIDRKQVILKRISKNQQFREEIYALQKLVRIATRTPVIEVCRGKCAYCEVRLDAEPGVVDWFRPAFAAERQNGDVAQSCYVWLADEWENIFICCATCSHLKRNMFPSRDDVHMGTSLDALRQREEGMLIDPGYDHPEQFFKINQDGILIPIGPRARETIRILELNRASLIAQRKSTISHFLAFLTPSLRLNDFAKISDHLITYLADGAPFVGSIYIFLRQSLKPNGLKILDKIIRLGINLESVRLLIPHLREISYQLRNPGAEVLIDVDEGRISTSQFRPIRRITINNFKGVHLLEIDFPESTENCVAIVGENSTGKTSVLQAIGLALAGPEEAHKVVPDARKVVGKWGDSGNIRVEFWGTEESSDLLFDHNSARFKSRHFHRVQVFGYGPFRVLSRRTMNARYRDNIVRLTSLFDDTGRINGYQGWLKKLTASQRQDIAEVLRLLLISGHTDIEVSTKSLHIRTNGTGHPLREMSSGMQSVVSFCTDAMEALYSVNESVVGAGCVLLIDELDAHLHPMWRVGIVPKLVKAFPNAQIIFSTHDPLCLRGLKSEQVHVLQRSKNGDLIHSKYEYSEAKSIDQLLTSSLFGLLSTHSEEWEQDYDEYVSLLLHRDRREITKEDMQRLHTLQLQMKDSNLIGDTRREQLRYAVINRVIEERDQKLEWNARALEELAKTVQEKLREEESNDRT